MKFTLSWLKEHLDTAATLGEISAKLTAIGLEVESIADRGQELAPFIIAHVLTAEKHPNADKLQVTTVDTGTEKLQVVCGAPNCRAGMKAVLARPGDYIPAQKAKLGKGVIRGVESQGMLCGAGEIGAGEDKGERFIIDLPADAPVGASFAEWAGLNDPVIEIKLTPNRPDCAGVRGIARDLAAAGFGKLKPLNDAPVAGRFKTPIELSIDLPPGEKDACPLIIGRHIKGIKNGESPAWLKRRLESIGLRPISAVVDITNFVSFDLARPLHAFDAAKLRGKLRVHLAKGGEELKLLNGKVYTLQPGMTIISDDSGPLELSAIMGGESTSCESGTTEILLISAYFDPIRTARGGRALGITSDARYRFERGIDPAFCKPGAEISTRLVMELCGGEASELAIVGEEPSWQRALALRKTRGATLVGVDVRPEEQRRILTALGCTVADEGSRFAVQPPSWRPDIHGEADLVEEVIRIHGYDHIPAEPLQFPRNMAAEILTALQRRGGSSRRALAAQGLLEAVTWSFMPSPLAAHFAAPDESLRLVNPISSDLDMMRPSTLGNLMQAAKRNADHGYPDVGLFEVGPVYHGAREQDQKLAATTLRAGHTPRHWAAPVRAVDVYDAKADAIAALAACGVKTDALQITADAPDYYHPGRSGCLRQGQNILASFGEMHPRLLAAIDTTQPMAGCEIWLGNIPSPKASATARPALHLAALQPVQRDFAFVVDAEISADKIGKCIRQVDKNMIVDVNVFDVYAGKNLGEGKKSLALSVTFQPREQSMTDEQLEQLSAAIVAAVAKGAGGTLRS